VHQAATALQRGYELGMVHRDIKPGNILMARQGKRLVVKVIDFGLAKAKSEVESDRDLTGTNMMMGTPGYSAPEQLSDAKTADTRSDVYALGCSLYHLLAGESPFKGNNAMAIALAQQAGAVRPLRQLRPEVPEALAQVVARMMAQEPAERFGQPGEVAAALLPFVKGAKESPESSGAVAAPQTVPPTLQTRVEARPRTNGAEAGGEAAAQVTMRPAKAPTVMRPAKGARKTIQGAGPSDKGKIERQIRIGVMVGGAVLGSLACIVVLAIVILSQRKSVQPQVSKGGQPQPSQGSSAQPAVFEGSQSQPIAGEEIAPAAGGQPQPIAGEEIAPATRRVYLSDLDETDWSGHEEFGKNGRSKYAAIAVNGTRFGKGLWTHPRDRGSCSVKYRLSGLDAATFVTKVAINDSAVRPAIATPLTFQVLGDGEVLWTSPPLREKGNMLECQVGMKGLCVLELRVNCPGRFDSAHAVWLDPYLLPGARESEPQALPKAEPTPARSSVATDAPKAKPQRPAASAVSPDGVLPVGADGEPLNFDFETGTLKDWTAEGEAFAGQPVNGDAVYRRLAHANIRSQHQGNYWIGGYEVHGDRPQGTLTSVPFEVTHPRASFLVGGGSGPFTYVELVRKDTGVPFWRTSGSNPPIETMRRVTVDLRKVHGKEIFIRLVDRDSGGWGHINFDDFRFRE
jgi:hypothetical protein